MVTFEYVGYFNGAEMVQVLNGIAAIVGSENGFGGLVKAIAIGGFITVMMTALIKLDIKEAAHYVLALAFVNTLMFAPLGRVVVIDKYAGTTTASATVVDKVPLGVAFAVGELNHIGVYMTDLYESVFSEVDAPKFTTTGMMFGARLYEKLGTLEISDVNMRRNMGSFVTSCVNPELVDYPNKVEPLRKSGKLVEDLLQNGMGILNPARIVSQTYSEFPLSCVEAGQRLALNFSAATTENVSNTILDKIGASLNLVSPRDVGAGNAALRSIVAQKMETGASYIMAQSLTAKDQIDQAVMANLFTSAQQNAGALSGDTATAISSVLAKRQVEQQYKTMRVIAEEALPRLRSMVEYVCVAIFPAVLLIMVAAGAKALLVLRVYLGILLSINLWPPLYAVVNHLMTLSSTKYKMAAIIQNEGVLSLNNIQAIQAAADSDLAMAGLLTLSIPAIALALVKGGDAALTGAIGGITAPATSAAGSVAANTSSGNFNYGNYGAGNFSAANTQLGQSRRSSSVEAGGASVDFGGIKRGAFEDGQGGITSTYDSSALTNKVAGLSGSGSSGFSTQKSAEVANAAAATRQAKAQFDNSIQAAGQKGATLTDQFGNTAGFNANAGSTIQAGINNAFEQAQSLVKQKAQTIGFSSADEAAVGINGGLKGSLGKGGDRTQSETASSGGDKGQKGLGNTLKDIAARKESVAAAIGGGVDANGKTSAQLRQEASAARQLADSDAVKAVTAIQTGSSTGVSLAVGEGSSSIRVNATGSQLAAIRSAGAGYDSAVKSEQNARTSLATGASVGADVKTDAVSDYIAANPGSTSGTASQARARVQAGIEGQQSQQFGTDLPNANSGVPGAAQTLIDSSQAATAPAGNLQPGTRPEGSAIGRSNSEVAAADAANAGQVGGPRSQAAVQSDLTGVVNPGTGQSTGSPAAFTQGIRQKQAEATALSDGDAKFNKDTKSFSQATDAKLQKGTVPGAVGEAAAGQAARNLGNGLFNVDSQFGPNANQRNLDEITKK